MIGYYFSVWDNDSYAFRNRPSVREGSYRYELHQAILPNMSGSPKTGVRRCTTCGELLSKWDEPLPGLKIKKRKYDISCTYDGITVASNRFKEVYDANHLQDLRFIPLPDDPSFYQIQARAIVRFDAEQRGTRFEKICAVCGQYESVVGATPVYLRQDESIPKSGFARTDLEFASGDEKHPLLLCGVDAGEILKSAKLRKLDLVAI